MALEEILKEIEERAKNRASEIEEEARKAKESIIKSAEERAKKIIEDAKKEAERRRKEELERTRALESIEKKKKILAEKRALIERAIEKGVEKLRDSEEYERFMQRISEISEGADKIIINEKDKIGRKKALEYGGIKGGAIITKGELTMDYSLESLMEECRDELEREIGELFDNG